MKYGKILNRIIFIQYYSIQIRLAGYLKDDFARKVLAVIMQNAIPLIS